MTAFYIIRHAEAEGNVYRRMHGHYDGRLTKRGERQLEFLASRFADTRVDAVYSSDLYRARKTAAVLGLPVTADARLREIHMGAWENVTFGEMNRFEPEQAYNLDHDPWNWVVPGAERFADTGARFEAVLRDIAEMHEGGKAAVVSHGLITRSFFCRILGVDSAEGYENVPMSDNTAVSRVIFSGGRFTLDFGGDASHIPEEFSTRERRRAAKERFGEGMGNLRFAQTGGYAWDALLGDTPVGAVALDPSRGGDAGVITRLELFREYRGMGLGIQLVGQAVSAYRAMGRGRVRVELPENAAGFFEHIGFEDLDGGAWEMNIS